MTHDETIKITELLTEVKQLLIQVRDMNDRVSVLEKDKIRKDFMGYLLLGIGTLLGWIAKTMSEKYFK